MQVSGFMRVPVILWPQALILAAVTALLLRAAIHSFRKQQVQMLVDGSDSNSATLAMQYLQGAALSWAGREQATRRLRHPEQMVRFVRVPCIELEPRVWYNPLGTAFYAAGMLLFRKRAA